MPDVSTTGNDSEKVVRVVLHLQQLTTPAVRWRSVWLTLDSSCCLTPNLNTRRF